MSKGYENKNGGFRTFFGDRTTFSTDNIPMLLLPDATVTVNNHSITFPDPTKARIEYWHFACAYDFFGEHYQDYGSTGQNIFTRVPQEYYIEDIIGTCPAGADLAIAKVSLSRTSAPSHTWNNQTLSVIPKENQTLILFGSMLLEAGFGISRLIHLYLSGTNIILAREQTIGSSAGISGQAGAATVAFTVDSTGEDMRNVGGAGVVVYAPTSSPYFKTSSSSGPTNYAGASSFCNRHKWSGSDPPSTSDPTNYASTYELDLEVFLGRKS